MPSRNPSSMLDFLRGEASKRRCRDLVETPLAAERQMLLEWIESRPDLWPPITPEELPRGRHATAGQRILLPGYEQPLHFRLRLWSRPQTWLPFDLDPPVTSTCNPVALLWSDDPATRKANCGAVALLRYAAAGDGPALCWILEHARPAWPAAAALVREHWDTDEMYEVGSGLVDAYYPSPRRLLQAALAGYERDLIRLAELADGGVDWHDPEGRDLPVPQGESRLPGEGAPSAAEWIKKL